VPNTRPSSAAMDLSHDIEYGLLYWIPATLMLSIDSIKPMVISGYDALPITRLNMRSDTRESLAINDFLSTRPELIEHNFVHDKGKALKGVLKES
jgi:hypothetical protein